MTRLRAALPAVVLLVLCGILYAGFTRTFAPPTTYKTSPSSSIEELPDLKSGAVEHKPSRPQQAPQAPPIFSYGEPDPSDNLETPILALTGYTFTGPYISWIKTTSTPPAAEPTPEPDAPKPVAVASAALTSADAGLALLLGHSIAAHNDLSALNAQLVLLALADETGENGITPDNRTRLEKAGWSVRAVPEIAFEGVDGTEVRGEVGRGLNKLQVWAWEEFERVVFLGAECVVKGSLAELLSMPGEFAAAPDVREGGGGADAGFSSGVMVIKPNGMVFWDIKAKMGDVAFHKPGEGDQEFLQTYYKFRSSGLPYKYNLDLAMQGLHQDAWASLWDEAVVVRFTQRRPAPDGPDEKGWCRKEAECKEWEALEWYRKNYAEMRSELGLDDEIPILG